MDEFNRREKEIAPSQIVVKPVINVFLNNCIANNATNFAIRSTNNQNYPEQNDFHYYPRYPENHGMTDKDHLKFTKINNYDLRS